MDSAAETQPSLLVQARHQKQPEDGGRTHFEGQSAVVCRGVVLWDVVCA